MDTSADHFLALRDSLSKIFEELQLHEREYRCFESHDSVPCVGTFKVNGNGEVRVALNFDDLRRVKMSNMRETMAQAQELMVEAEKHMQEIIGMKPPPPPSEFDLRLQKAVEDGFNQKETA